MGLMAEEFKELRQIPKLLIEGKLEREDAKIWLNALKESHKRVSTILEFYIACNKPHLIEGRFHSLNLISKGEFVQTSGEIEIEMLKCPDQDKVITRENCLSYSGEEKNIESCRSCENFAITRKLLIKE